MRVRDHVEALPGVSFAEKEPRRRAHADHLGDERKEHVGHVVCRQRVNQIGRSCEADLRDPLRGAEAPDELAVRRGRHEKQQRPAHGLFQRKRPRAKDDGRSTEQEHLDERDEEQCGLAEHEAAAENRPEQRGRSECRAVRKQHDRERARDDIAGDAQGERDGKPAEPCGHLLRGCRDQSRVPSSFSGRISSNTARRERFRGDEMRNLLFRLARSSY